MGTQMDEQSKPKWTKNASSHANAYIYPSTNNETTKGRIECCQTGEVPRHLAGLEVLKEDLESGRVLTVVGDDNARAANDLSGLALTVDLGETGPLTKDLGVRDLDELDTVLSAESLDELEVLGLGDSLDKDTEVSLLLVKSLGALPQTPGKTVVDESGLDDLLESVLDRHGAGLGGDLDLLGLDFGVVGSGFRSSVRH